MRTLGENGLAERCTDHVGIGLLACVVLCTAIIAKRLSARQLIVHRISEIVSIYVCTCTCMYVHVSVTQLHVFRALRANVHVRAHAPM